MYIPKGEGVGTQGRLPSGLRCMAQSFVRLRIWPSEYRRRSFFMSIRPPFVVMLLFGAASSATVLPASIPSSNTSAAPVESAQKMQWSSGLEAIASAGVSAADQASMQATIEGCLAFEPSEMNDCVLAKCNQQWPQHEHFVLLLGPGYFFPGMAWNYGRKTQAEQYAIFELRTTGKVRMLIQRMHF